jgi:hypothetical protein
MRPPLYYQRYQLPFVAVRLQALDEQRQPIDGAVASGFIRRLDNQLYLYTCWHVVTGFDPYDVQIGFTLPNRRYLVVALQAAAQRGPGYEVVGGLQTLELPLYDVSAQPALPLWEQDDQHIPHAELNGINVFVPFWHDVVRIKLPADLSTSEVQLIDEQALLRGDITLISPGDKCLLVGYPYGFSAFGQRQPTPVALTRFVASDRVEGRHQQFLLDGIGAPGMSGGPVFIEREQDLLLVGMYTGSIYPDHARYTNEKVTALGTVANISMLLWGALPLVARPSTLAQTGA